MSVLDRVRDLVTATDGADLTLYECDECGATFESAKTPERAVCEDCLSHEVQPVE